MGKGKPMGTGLVYSNFENGSGTGPVLWAWVA